MTATVLKFPTKKKPVVEPARDLYCRRCDFDFFILRDDGSVICGKCKSVMRNLFVTMEGANVPA